MSESKKFDTGKPPISLIPHDYLVAVAEVLAFGAQKYSKYGDCTCLVKNANALKSRLVDCVSVITTGGLSEKTQNINKDRQKTVGNGEHKTKIACALIVEHAQRNTATTLLKKLKEDAKQLSVDINLQTNSLTACGHDAATFVKMKNFCESITTIRPNKSGVYSVTDVTLSLDGLKNEAGSWPHLSTCESRQVLVTGKHNWRETGFDWSRLIDAAYRHLGAFNDGEDRDPESGLSHVAHLACAVMFLLVHERQRLGNDNRFKRSRAADLIVVDESAIISEEVMKTWDADDRRTLERRRTQEKGVIGGRAPNYQNFPKEAANDPQYIFVEYNPDGSAKKGYYITADELGQRLGVGDLKPGTYNATIRSAKARRPKARAKGKRTSTPRKARP